MKFYSSIVREITQLIITKVQSVPRVIKKMHVQVVLQYHHTPIRMAKMKEIKLSHVDMNIYE
jgi:hypothetical protein